MTLGLFDVAFLGALSGGSAYDADAQDYINRVIAADVAAGNSSGLEAGVQDAINAFVVGCKADGIWNAIKASCIMAGARTLQGCLVPLVGTAPTNFNFDANDYDRRSGLLGNRSNKYLSTNRNNNADPQDNCHISVYASFLGTLGGAYIGCGANSSVARALQFNIGHKCSNANFTVDATPEAGFIGASRISSASYTYLNGGSSLETLAIESAAPLSQTINLFQRGGASYSNARLSFYSLGEALDLALLRPRVTALMNALAAAIP
jgi:hypothetical protein